MRLLIAAVAAVLLISPAVAAPAMMTTSGMMMIHHRVADYAKWRPVYDADQSNREAAGLTNCRVHQSMSNANDVVIACDMADMNKAEAFASSTTMRDTMKKAGVMGKPEMLYLSAAK